MKFPEHGAIEQLLAELGALDIVVRAEDDRLKVNAPKGVMTPDLAARIKDRKEELLGYLSRTRGGEERIPRAPTHAEIPLSYAQLRMWFLDQLEARDPSGASAGATYNIPLALRLQGKLDPAVLSRSVSLIAERHQTLRSAFPSVAGEPGWTLLPANPIEISAVSLENDPQPMETANRLVAAEALRPFDLARGPLFRLRLFRLATDDHVLILVMHHIISDGWSSGVLIQELTQLYGYFGVHGPDAASPLPDLEIQYSDFAYWQRGWLTGEVRARQTEYWRDKLADIPLLHRIPTDRPRPRVMTYRGADYQFEIRPDRAENVKELAKSRGASLFMILQAVFAVLLARYARQRVFCIGTPVANRNRKQLEPLIGLFVNTLVLRNDLSDDPSFSEFLERVKKTALEAYDHQDIPFEQIVDALQPERGLSYAPIFQIMFSMVNTPVSRLDLPGLKLSPLDPGKKTTKFDLTLNMNESEHGLACSFEYSTDLFDEATIVRMSVHLQNLLRSVTADPSRRISRLEIMSAEEREEAVIRWNRNDREVPDAGCIYRLFEAKAARHPDALALDDGLRRITYAALDRRANQVASRLRGRGAGPQVRVGLLIERSIEMVVGLYGILKAGAAYVPMDPTYPEERIRFMLRDAQAPILVTVDRHRGDLAETGAEILALDGDWPDLARCSPEPGPGASRDNLIYIIYTSGSTGTPKGAGVNHRGFLNLVWWFVTDFSLTERDSVMVTSSASFDLTQKNFYAPLIVGGVMRLSPAHPYDPRRINAMVEHGRATWLNCTPSAFYPLIEDGGPDWAENLRTLRWVFLGGEPISIARLLPWIESPHFHGTIVNTYGPTECTDISNFRCLDEPARFLNKATPIGKSVYNARLLILDPDLELLPLGGQGELCIFGAGVGPGYLNDPVLTAIKFAPNVFSGIPGDRLYRTGDLVKYFDPRSIGIESPPDGDIEFIGRIDHQIKIRGFRIELGEIESALASVPGVREPVALIREDRPGDKRIVAFIELERDAETPDFRNPLTQTLPEYMIPNRFMVLDTFPLTPSGKIDRNALAAMPLPEQEDGPKTETPPANEIEQRIAAIFAEVLGRKNIDVVTGFFNLGGHSLLATRVMSRICSAFEVELPLQAIFETPTVRGLAERLARSQETSVPPLKPVPREGPLPLSFPQERLWFLYRMEGPSSTYNMPIAVKLRGSLKPGILAHAAAEVVRRHEILRTTFPIRDGQPVQALSPPGPLALPLIDLASLTDASRLASGLIERAAVLPFILEEGPLLRLLLLRVEAGTHLLLVNMHHIVSDGWSLSVFTNELAVVYRAYSRDPGSCGSPVLPELAVQYADYADWQRQWLQDGELDRQLSYWRERLAGHQPLSPPTDYPRPANRTFSPGSVSRTMSASISSKLGTVAREEDASLFMLLLSGFAVLLARHAGQDDFTVGTPISGRNHRETEPLIGFFLNTLVLRLETTGAPTFREMLRRTREETLNAYRRQDAPFEKLLQELNPERDLSRTPLFQVFFNMLNLPEPDSGTGEDGLILEPMGAGDVGAKFDITIYAAETPDGIFFSLHYNADLFESRRMTELLEQYSLLLDGIAADPDRAIGTYDLVTSGARAILPDPTAAMDGAWRGSVHRFLAQMAGRFPDNPAVVGPDFSLDYRALHARTNRLAHWLAARGVGKGDRIAIYAARCPSLVVAVFASLKTGAAITILDPAYPSERLRHYLDPVAPKVWLALQSAGTMPEPLAEIVRPIPIRLTIGPEGGSSETEDLPDDFTEIEVGPDDLACIAFTSGSTGKPKAIAGRHGPLTHFLPWLAETFGFNPGDRFSMLSGLAHDPLQRDMFTPLCTGASVHVPDPDDIGPGRLTRWMADHGITVSHLTPAMARILVEHPEDRVLDRFRLAFVTGDVLTRRDVDRLHGISPSVHVANFYGSTETQRAVGFNPAQRADREPGRRLREVLPLGKGIPGVQLLILNPHRKLAGIGEIGEIHVRSPHLAAGYLSDPAGTEARFIANPLTGRADDRVYRTGDLGYYLPDGRAVFAGRNDHQVKIRGYRIEIPEIEAVLAAHPAVEEAVVLLRGEPDNRSLTAYLQVVRPPANLAGLLREHVKTLLPAFMVPADYVVLERLPLTPNAKIDRSALMKIEPQTAAIEQESIPQTPIEEILTGIWTEVLDRENIAVHADFFALGGHSLLATGIISRIRAMLRVDLPLRAMFEAPTIAETAAWIERQQRETNREPPIQPRPRDMGAELLPLSYAQIRLWFLDRLEGPNPAYNMPFALRLDGPLDIRALDVSLKTIVMRHEILRARFEERDGRGFLSILPDPGVALPVLDLAGLEKGGELIHRLAAVESGKPFNLERDRLLRSTLLRLGPNEHVLLLTMHHIVSDGWSLGILAREIHTLYNHDIAQLPELPVQYPDFSIWQRDWLRDHVLDRQLRYWKTQLADTPPLLSLPTDRPRPREQTYRGARTGFSLGPERTAKLQALARSRGATLFMVLDAGYSLLLSKYSGARDLTIGTPVANRTRPELEPLIGFFVNTLVLRHDLSGDPTFSDHLDRVREVALQAYAHQDAPFEQVIDAVQPDRSLGVSPLFQVMLVFQNLPRSRTGASGLTLSVLHGQNTTAKFDLTLTLSDNPEGVTGLFEYNTDLFDAATIQAMARHLTNLLTAAASEPERALSRIEILEPDERTDLLRQWNASLNTSTVFIPVHHRFEAAAATHPDRVALIGPKAEQIAYSVLNRRANGLAERLIESGAGPEKFAGIHMERGSEMIVAVLAVLKSGAAYVPLDPAYPAERLDFMIRDSGMTALVTYGNTGPTRAGSDLPVIDAGLRGDRDKNPELAVEPGNPSHLIYTSGSTGRPKGVIIAHRGAAALIDWANRTYTDRRTASVLAATSLSFDLSVFELFAPLSRGGRVVLAENALALVDHPARHEITLINTVPSAMAGLLRSGALPKSIATVNLAGEPLHRDLARAILERNHVHTLYNLYGPSEDTTYSTFAPIDPDSPREPGIGAPINGSAAYVLDESMSVLPAGLAGELFLAGDGLARGYHGRPDLTADRFVPNPFSGMPGDRLYRTGDRARFRDVTGLDFLGRTDFQIKLRGFRIELGEIESALRALPGVEQAAVLVRDGRLVVFAQSDKELGTEWQTELARVLPGHMVPRRWVVLASMPMTPNGKIDRRALAATHIKTHGRGPEHVPPRTEPEKALCRIWSEILGKKPIGIDDNFFDLGGDSIIGLQITARARQAGIRLTPKQLFAHQTVRELAAAAETSAETAVDAEQGQVTGPVPLTPIQHWFFERLPQNPNHFNQSLLFSMAENVDYRALETAFAALIRHHDALRLRFRREADRWFQKHEPEARFSVPVFELGAFARPGPVLTRIAQQFQQSLDLHQGPVIRAVVFRHAGEPQAGRGRPHRLLIAAHHLVIDGISWRILLEDLQTAYRSLLLDRSVVFPQKTTSFKAWSQRLQTLARGERAQREAPSWNHLVDVRTLPVDGTLEPRANIEGAAETLTIEFDTDATHSLLHEVNRPYRTRIEDFLLTALLEAVTARTGVPAFLVDLESHGREELFEDVDLTRTVGWFTALYPVLLSLSGNPHPAANLKAVKETLRAIRHGGIGYGLRRYLSREPVKSERVSSILFNYLGQTRGTSDERAILGPAPESPGRTRDPRTPRSHAIEINAIVTGGGLSMNWTYHPGLHHRETVAALTETYRESLLRLIRHCLAEPEGGFTPSDFPLAGLNQETLDRLIETAGEVTDIYPLSPMQEGMLFHALSEPGSGNYFIQLGCVFGPGFEPGRFKRIWQQVVQRHPILRTSFHWQALSRPLQVVHPEPGLVWIDEDWRGRSRQEADSRIETLRRDQRARDFVLETAPLMRMHLIRLEEDRFQFIWHYHHLLLDGWSAPILFREVLTLYLNDEAVLPAARPYRDYIAWLEARPADEARRYWRDVLKNFREPNPLPHVLDREIGPRELRPVTRILTTDETERLETRARERRITLNTLTQAAWALIMAAHDNTGDTLFGAVVSGRPAELEGVDAMTGLFINILPVRTLVGDQPVSDWLRGLHADQIERERFGYLTLAELRDMSSVPKDRPLFQTMVVFENYPVDPASPVQDGHGLSIEHVRQQEQTHYPLVLIAIPGKQLQFKLGYEANRFRQADMERLMEQFHAVLMKLADEPVSTPAAIVSSMRDESRQSRAVTPADVVGMTENQLIIWMGQKMDPTDLTYHNVLCFTIHGRVDREHFSRAFQAVVQGGDALRTVFLEQDGLPRGAVLPTIDAEPEYHDFSTTDHPESAFRAWLDHQTKRGLDLTRRAFECALCKLAEEKYVWFVNLHQLIMDGGGASALYRRTAEWYRASIEGRLPDKPELPRYADYLEDERGYRESRQFRRDNLFWQQKLSGDRGPVAFYGGKTERPTAPLHTLFRDFDEKRLAEIDRFLAEHARGGTRDAARFHFFLTALTILVHKLSGNRTLTIGLPMHNRRSKSFKSTIGSFMQVLPLCIELDPDEPVVSLMKRVAALSFECMRHGRAVIRNPRQNPVYDIILNYHVSRFPAFDGAPIDMEWVHPPNGHTGFTFQVDDFTEQGGLQLVFELHEQAFEEAVRDRVPGHLFSILQGLLLDPAQKAVGIDPLTPEERIDLLIRFNTPAYEIDSQQTVLDLVERAALRYPNHPALIVPGPEPVTLDYRELDRRATVLADWLSTIGLGPESRVGLCLDRSPALIAAVLAVLKTGAAYVPLDPDYPSERLAFMLDDARVAAAVTEHRFLEKVSRPGLSLLCLSPNRLLPTLNHGHQTVPVHRENAAYLVYTSGSTGRPKGVTVSHGAIYSAYRSWERDYRLEAAKTVHLQMAGFSFDVFSGDLVRALCSAGTLVLAPREWLLVPERLFRLMRETEITHAEFVPAVLRLLADYLENRGENLGFVRLLAAGSDVWYGEEYRQFRSLLGPEGRLINSYGVSEATVDSTFFEESRAELAIKAIVPIGRPFGNTRLYVLDHSLRPIPTGVPGELFISGRGLARGYHDRPDLSADRFIPDPFTSSVPGSRLYRTGDLARHLPGDGPTQLAFLGRNDQQIKIRGFRVELEEIEAVLRSRPEVTEAVVLVRDGSGNDNRAEQFLVAHIQPETSREEHKDPTNERLRDELRTLLRARLPVHMVPDIFDFIKRIPLTPNGKIDRGALSERTLTEASPGASLDPPRDPLELGMAALWEEVLQRRGLGIHDNFFDLGGHSLLAVRLIARVRERFGKPVDIGRLFSNPTVASLTDQIREDAEPESWRHIVPLRTGGPRTPLYLIHAAGGNIMDYQALVRALGPDRPLFGIRALGLEHGQEPLDNIETMAARYLEEIVHHQPEGPYHLAGWSLGGAVAFEIVRQLSDPDTETARLILIDSMPSDKMNLPEVFGEPEIMVSFIRQLTPRAVDLDLSPDAIRNIPEPDRLAHVLARAREEGVLPADSELETLIRRWTVFRAHALAGYRYRPEPIAGRLHLIRAAERDPRIADDPHNGWLGLTREIHVETIPGDHKSIMTEPRVNALARTIENFLNQP